MNTKAEFPLPAISLDLIKKAHTLWLATEQLSQALWDTFADEFVILDDLRRHHHDPHCDLPHDPLPF